MWTESTKTIKIQEMKKKRSYNWLEKGQNGLLIKKIHPVLSHSNLRKQILHLADNIENTSDNKIHIRVRFSIHLELSIQIRESKGGSDSEA